MMDDYPQFALPEEERRRLLLSNLMMGLGAGLLDSRGKNVWPAISTGLLGGMQMGQQAIGNAQQGMVARYKLQREAEQDNEKKRMAAARAGADQQIADVINAPDIDPAKKFDIYTRAANIAAMNNDKEKAAYFEKLADKFRPKYSATPHTVMVNGQPVLAQTSEYDAPRILEGVAPKPEISWQDTGGGLVARDSLTTQAGDTIPKTLTPGNVQQQKQWEQEQALRVRADKRAAQAASAGGGPGKAPEGYRWGADGKSLEFIPGGPKDPAIAKKEDKPTDQQLAAGAFHSRMAEASNGLSALEKKDQIIGLKAAAAEATRDIPMVGGMVGPAVNAYVSSQAVQEYNTYKRAWIRANLRKESGAVIGAEEEKGEERTYFPVYGDKAEVIKKKAALRAATERAVAMQARNQQDDPLGLR